MKKLVKVILFVIKRYYYSFVIRNYDKQVDLSYSKNTLSENGFEVLDISDLFENSDELRRSLSEIKTDNRAEGVDMSWTLPKVFWEELLKSSELTEKVQGYLGVAARLDDAYLKTIKDGVKSVSEGWHNDNVGYRLKLFIVFETEGQAAPTVILPGKRPKLYRFNLIEDTSRLFFGKSDLGPRKRQQVVEYSSGTCLLFDTNLEHRGGFSEGAGVRHCVIVEFICRKKANKLSGFSPCGPRQGGGQIKISAQEKLVEQSPILDTVILNNFRKNEYLYGLEKTEL